MNTSKSTELNNKQRTDDEIIDELRKTWEKIKNETNYYAVLEVSKDSSPNDIKKAYLKAALKFHPDRLYTNSTILLKLCTQIFQKINTANETLSDADKRKEYDATISANREFPCTFKDFFSNFHNFAPKDQTTCTLGAESTNKIISEIKLLVQSIIEKPETKWIGGYRYQAVSELARKLLNEISEFDIDFQLKIKKNNGYQAEIPSFTRKDFHEFIFCVQHAVRNVENDDKLNMHRGYIRTIPVLREITTILQVLIRSISLGLYKLYDRTNPYYPDGLMRGLFTPPKTNTREKIDILNEQLTSLLEKYKPFEPFQDDNFTYSPAKSHYDPSITLRYRS